ncbi:uncharacterized protein LACBIDRAFT_300036 [Laccaria bicolor S238N-H82]|uniref:Predicted protein n=1 Tax=Laccaria bicolor (strain S238N-H82 / ATCC MYA-4686) TaxID=486041 RepID=B0DFW8_LACBS|nr:uncharacterized protein LACBIDRAFT_300036 [Laccaria bicolor S238N-H82]EDR06414.1 predicted protein [Laccaria bicolor S238N-H82]|eukprot:XP_001882786.1 predicted protein [Laccaria bicolor S238N-H82]
MQQPQFYSPDPAMIFSGVVACAAEVCLPTINQPYPSTVCGSERRRRCGGSIVRYAGDDEEDEEDPDEEVQEQKKREMDRKEANALKGCDILVTRWRSGRPYVRAFRNGKTIGTLAWVFHVQSTGILSRPLDQLLHYPVPKKPIENFSLHVRSSFPTVYVPQYMECDANDFTLEITVTNYTGEAREYLKKLISAMPLCTCPFLFSFPFTSPVLPLASHLPLSATNANKAFSWSIPVANYTWLDYCFVQWRNLKVGVENEHCLSPGVDFSMLLGVRGVGVGRGVRERSEGDGGRW